MNALEYHDATGARAAKEAHMSTANQRLLDKETHSDSSRTETTAG